MFMNYGKKKLTICLLAFSFTLPTAVGGEFSSFKSSPPQFNLFLSGFSEFNSLFVYATMNKIIESFTVS